MFGQRHITQPLLNLVYGFVSNTNKVFQLERRKSADQDFPESHVRQVGDHAAYHCDKNRILLYLSSSYFIAYIQSTIDITKFDPRKHHQIKRQNDEK